MISAVSLVNYKSFIKTSIETKPLTILAGLNNSGKSSIIQAIRMIFKFFQSPEKTIELDNHVSPRLQRSKSTKDVFFKIALTLDTGENAGLQVSIDGESYSLKETGEKKPNFFPDLLYLSAGRLGPENTLKLSPENRRTEIGVNGEYIIDFIDKNKEIFVNEKLQRAGAGVKGLWDNINAWLQYISPRTTLLYDIRREYNTSYPYYGYDKILPTETGFGLSYTLPLITALLSPQSSAGDVLLLENPEGHLHPKGQAAIGELIALAASRDKQIILETHSDHILNGIRVAIKEKKVNYKDVAVLFLEKKIIETESYTDITEILIDKNGTLSEYPDNFMDEWSNQLSKLI